jgi:L-alanine-DL-glutamate epimerase-like enolase superfamily enzyme
MAIETLHWAEYPRFVVVRVHTDTGLIGLGETVDKVPGSIAALHGVLAPHALGRDPLQIEALWQDLFKLITYHGYAGAEGRALSALEIALWDLMGKHYGAPVYELLGGKVRDAVPCYNTCAGFGPANDYEAWHTDAGELARSLLADGIRAMKIWPFDPYARKSRGQYISVQDAELGLRPIRQIRDAVGQEMEIGIEFHFNWNRAALERIVAALEGYNILFLEDVMPATQPDEIKLLSQRTSIPIVGSELLMTRFQIREWLEKHAAQIVMTDPLWTGGLGETRRIANLAEAFGVPVVFHNIAGPVGHAACMHLGAHVPNLFMSESVRAFYRTYFPELSNLAPRATDSRYPVPEGPGLGVTLREQAFSRSDLDRRITTLEDLRAAGPDWAWRMGMQHSRRN